MNRDDHRETLPAGGDSANFDLRGMLETPAGVPGVVMVSATNNGNGAAPAADPFGFGMHVGARDQLAYYSSYGSRVDLAAPGGARRFNLPGWDGGDGNILYGGWGSLGALLSSTARDSRARPRSNWISRFRSCRRSKSGPWQRS